MAVTEMQLLTLYEQTRVHSSPQIIRSTPAYRIILQLGKEAVPALLDELRGDTEIPFTIMLLLEDIVDTSPVKDEHYGNISLMRSDWISFFDVGQD